MTINDTFYQLPPGAIKTTGIFDDLLTLVSENTLKKVNFRTLADYYRNKSDHSYSNDTK